MDFPDTSRCRDRSTCLSRRVVMGSWAMGAAGAVLAGQQGESPAQEAPVEAPAAASNRTKELTARLSLEVPPPVKLAHSISYRLSTREDADSRRLDVYRNLNYGKQPVVIFFHGGAWRGGHRRQYIPLGVGLALKKLTCVIPSYSKAPKYPFPEPVIDAAAVVRWVYDNIGGLGGDPKKIFLAGHSSGVQIAALAALDPRYLQFHYLEPEILRGVVCISGIYEVPPGFDYAFRGDAETRKIASPLNYVREGAPPFLVVAGGRDAGIVQNQTPAFVSRLKGASVPTETELYPDEDHNSMIVLASIRGSSLQEKIEDFVWKHA